MLATPPKTAAKIDPKLIVPFVNSVRSVLLTMANLQTIVGPSRIKTGNGPDFHYSGIIGFSGKIVGTVVVSFQRAAAIRIVEAFAGMPIEPDTADFADAIGELANMIAGAAKKEFGADASISIPSVVMGAGHVIARPSEMPCVVVPCQVDEAAFTVELSLRMA